MLVLARVIQPRRLTEGSLFVLFDVRAEPLSNVNVEFLV